MASVLAPPAHLLVDPVRGRRLGGGQAARSSGPERAPPRSPTRVPARPRGWSGRETRAGRGADTRASPVIEGPLEGGRQPAIRRVAIRNEGVVCACAGARSRDTWFWCRGRGHDHPLSELLRRYHCPRASQLGVARHLASRRGHEARLRQARQGTHAGWRTAPSPPATAGPRPPGSSRTRRWGRSP